VILILSHPGDDHAAGVLSVLAGRRHPAAILDLSRFPARASLSQCFDGHGAQVSFVSEGSRLDLTSCHAAWWRRPQPYTLHQDLDPATAGFAYTECHEAFSGALALLDATWVNEPHVDERAHHKPLQLAVAQRVGLTIPRTLITNDPDDARRFADELGPGRTIYKTFVASEAHWRETRVLHPEEVDMLDSLSLAPAIFQELVPAEADLRVTMVGDEVFATAIRADRGGYTLDYRLDMTAASFEPTQLPEPVTDRLRALMRELGLVYGAIDLRRTEDARYIFLEVNPAGEWRFVEERTAQPITVAMADLLARLDTA
jgi:glutathione synthase/RimK-type ligase-like ATP-grasp enzyme